MWIWILILILVGLMVCSLEIELLVVEVLSWFVLCVNVVEDCFVVFVLSCVYQEYFNKISYVF